MKNKQLFLPLTLAATLALPQAANAQTSAASETYGAKTKTDRTLFFDTTAEGVKLPIEWGLDTAWPSEENIRRGISYIGASNITLARASFQPWGELVNGQLPDSLRTNLLTRLNYISRIGKHVGIELNDDPGDGSVVPSAYKGNAKAWADLITATAKIVQEKGFKLVSVAPFNEPDYGWGQGTMTDFYNIAKLLKEEYPGYDTIRICGGNTLNCDQALTWYNGLKEYLDEGNTHQLAGDFDHYADFFKQVRADGKHATADELHNVMEAMVGVEYGMQSGIWWGTAELARGEFCKASFGDRLAYAENRSAWSAASVYRNTEGKIQAFGGTSERQAATSNYRFVSKDRDVYFNGYGPTREYVMDLPGGTGYQQGQSNAECVVNITWGEDVQPVIDGTYVIMNAATKKVLTVANGSTASGASLCQNRYSDKAWQQWKVEPVSTTVGGDFSYHSITSARDDKSLDVLNWSLDANGSIILYDKSLGNNQQWILEYAGDGFFYIKSRHSNLCLEVPSSSTKEGVNILQAKQANVRRQKWRLLPVGAECELTAPGAPSALRATPQMASVRLDWTASASDDVESYTILRADSANGEFNTIGRYVKETSFIDNTAEQGKSYCYKVKAVDKSLNTSAASDIIEAATSGEKGLIAQYQFEDTLRDYSHNSFGASSSADVAYEEGKSGQKSLRLKGETDDFVQLPYQVGNNREMTVTLWAKCRSNTSWQRLFDFGNGEDEYMFLTPRDGSGKMRFVLKNGGAEQVLVCDEKPNLLSWVHFAVTLSADSVVCYLDGVKVGEAGSELSIRPSDFKPVLNYIGRSQYDADPLLKANIDDFRVYNRALSASEIAEVMSDLTDDIADLTDADETSPVIGRQYFTMDGRLVNNPEKGLYIEHSTHKNGKVTARKIAK